ncbi:MAG: DUF4386 domain-containing protein [Oscillochloris sp.]|nr:DUF4386 domain-containing protein [Oscillochloris sp.]
MNTFTKTSRILGLAFLVQFITSFSSGLFLQPQLIVPGSSSESMIRIAQNPTLMKAYILVDMLTALGVIFLGAMLFVTVRNVHEKLALTALGFYVLEGGLLATSRSDAFTMVRISQEYISTGRPAALETMATLTLESMDFVGFTLHMLAFCAGAILFYALLVRSRAVPQWMSLWGLISVIPLLIATLLGIFDYQVSFIVALPYIPFELVIGIWIVIKGVPEPEPSLRNSLVPA